MKSTKVPRVFSTAGLDPFDEVKWDKRTAEITDVLRELLGSPPVDGEAMPIEKLSKRQKQLLILLDKGMSNRDIAENLEISEHTVKFHVNAVLGKLGVASRTEAVVRATRLGLIFL